MNDNGAKKFLGAVEWNESRSMERGLEISGPVVTRTDGTKVEIRPKQRFRFSVDAVRRNLDKFGEE